VAQGGDDDGDRRPAEVDADDPAGGRVEADGRGRPAPAPVAGQRGLALDDHTAGDEVADDVEQRGTREPGQPDELGPAERAGAAELSQQDLGVCQPHTLHGIRAFDHRTIMTDASFPMSLRQRTGAVAGAVTSAR
jgi:hypothetical protein